ncbi:MAG: hypothetical protein JXB34_13870 [Bacteroidales bacterium]|nr:hypothetical protein [Bacteroidales bacterium]
MNKRITKKLVAAFAVAAIFVGGVFAQSTDVPGTAADYASGAVQAQTYIMEGTTVPVYALPDPYFHPAYNADGANSLTADFTWTWAEASTTLTFSQNDAEDNYVEITAPAGSAAGSPYTVTVTENAPAAYGGCSGAQTNLVVNVVAQPNITIAADATYTFCEGDAGLPADIQSAITGGWQNYRLVWNLEIATLNNAMAKEFYYDDENGANPAGAQKYAVNYTTLAPQEIATAAAAPDLMTVGDFLVINNGTRDAVTVYTYNLVSINDQASRYGNFMALGGGAPANDAFTYYAAADQVIVTVYPAPVTGPIYHITNTWAE